MEAETIIPPKSRAARLVAKPTLSEDQPPVSMPVNTCKAMVFFIGGTGGRGAYYFAEPYENLDHLKAPFDKRIEEANKDAFYRSHYMNYNDPRGGDIKNFVISQIPNKATPVYIVGHSLGAWIGAHLSNILSAQGYRVEMLITLDPVGEGTLMWLGSATYYKKPEPSSGVWINVRATPSRPNPSDSVADFGERWIIHSGPDINHNMDTNHANAWDMFLNPIQGAVAASDYLYESIIGCTNS